MAEPIQARRNDPKLFFKLDPGEPGLLRSARASESVVKVTEQEQRNLNRLRLEAVREGRRVVAADATFEPGIDGSFASIRAGRTVVRTAPLEREMPQTANAASADAGNAGNSAPLNRQRPIEAFRADSQRLAAAQPGGQTDNPAPREAERDSNTQDAGGIRQLVMERRRLPRLVEQALNRRSNTETADQPGSANTRAIDLMRRFQEEGIRRREAEAEPGGGGTPANRETPDRVATSNDREARDSEEQPTRRIGLNLIG